MHKLYYDLHIHSALSPCAENDMTPNDIVGMALLNGLDLIAITDHNSARNARAVMNVAKDKNIIVLPGMEVSTVEEVHVLCLFSAIEEAENFEKEVEKTRSKVINRKEIFGNQLVYNESDELTDEVSELLIAPTSLGFYDLHKLTNKLGGAFIPAHIDRDSFSVLSNLGFLPPDLYIKTIEVSQLGVNRGYIEKNSEKYTANTVLTSSDAHRLWDINERVNFITLPSRTSKAIIDFLR